ncbi:MAG: gluconokinase, partial [Candidatus Sulfotelmatobacter sp.]
YRQALQVGPEVEVNVKLVYLKAAAEVLRQRLRERRGHFMTERLLASQPATLEAPAGAVTVDADRSPAEIVAEIRARLALPE